MYFKDIFYNSIRVLSFLFHVTVKNFWVTIVPIDYIKNFNQYYPTYPQETYQVLKENKGN